MIQLAFESVAQIVPEWENGQERLIFRLTLASVCCGEALHERMGEADQVVGMVALDYDGDLARQARVILELPDDIWNHLANQADELLESQE